MSALGNFQFCLLDKSALISLPQVQNGTGKVHCPNSDNKQGSTDVIKRTSVLIMLQFSRGPVYESTPESTCLKGPLAIHVKCMISLCPIHG